MSSRMRIGEVLLLRESIDALLLSQTVRQQAETGQRLISTLIARALIEPDEGALALSEQTGFPAALQRHLERRDPAVAAAIPAQLARTWVVVPIGRSRHGDLVVAARDPTPILAAALEHAVRMRIKLAVAPAVHVERLVRAIYGADVPGDEHTPLPSAPPSLADIGETTVGVTGAPSRRARTISRVAIGVDDSGPITMPVRSMSALEITLQEIDQAFSLVAVERMVMSYAAARWTAALMFTIADGVAHAQRNQLGAIEGVALPLDTPSSLQLAVTTQRTAQEAPDSPVQRALHLLLGQPRSSLAAPIEVAREVRGVLVVGDPMTGAPRDETSSSAREIIELDRLADALGAAYARFARTATRDL